VAITPTWSETAEFADYVLPMGHAAERHDTMSYETHSGKWLGFRQPVRRVAMEKLGRPVTDTRDANPGEVWEETEFFFELSWRIDPDGSLGIRRHFESPYRPGEKITAEDYYRWMFENNVPGLPEKAAAVGLTPLEYMRKFGVVSVDESVYRVDEQPVEDEQLKDATVDDAGVYRNPVDFDSEPPLIGEAGSVAVRHEDGTVTTCWPTPSRRLEIYSPAMRDWGWPEHATPGYIESHISPPQINTGAGELVLVPTFRLPVLILRGEHSRLVSARQAQGMRRRIPGSALKTIASAHHHISLDNPDATSAAIAEFIASL